MTVYSINKRVIEQANNVTPAANAKTTSDAAQEFVSALQQASIFTAGARGPSAEAALQSHFDRPADDNRSAKAAAKAEKAEAKPAARDRSRDDKSTGRTEKVKTKDSRDDQAPVKAEAADAPVKKTDADQAPVKAEASEAAPETTAKQADDTTTVVAQTEQTAAVEQVAIDPQIVVAPVQVQQQAEVTVAEDTAATQKGAEVVEETKPVETEAADAQQGKAAQATTDASADAAATDALDTQTADAAQAALRSGNHEAAKTEQNTKADDLAQAQSDDLAQRLDGTGAQLKVQVQVGSAQAESTGTMTAAADTPVVAQDMSAKAAPVQTAPQTDTQAPGVAAAAQQAAAANAAEAAAQQSKLVQAKAMDPALLAQLEASNQADAPATQTNTQPVAGLGNAAGTPAAQKAAPPQAAQAPRFQLPKQEEVMNQVSIQILKQAKNGSDSIKVQLKPVELGAIEIKLEVAKDGTVSAVVTADNKDTLAMLQKDSSNLQKALEDAGLKTDSNSMTFNLREGHQQAQQNGNDGSGRRRSRLSAAAAADAAANVQAAQAQARWNTGRAGVDIKV
ncbi:MAG: flagellar hook-length control protein FliK [Rhodospirillaceae bacterium]|nr:flagellar hook-length control protein FliK [Rhodospirillales bacterium]